MSLVLSLGAFAPVMLALMGVLMVVLRAGASRVYFDVVGTFQADRMLKDAQAMSTTMNSLMLDAFSGIEEAAMVLGEPFARMVDDLLPIAKEVGEARIEFEKFVQEGEDLEAVTAAVVNIGEAFAFAGDESLRAAARMAQLGGVLGPGMVGPGTEIGMIFGLISGMETEAAMQRMINLQQQTHFMTDALEDNLTMEERAIQIRSNSMNVLDQLNTVENRSAATMSQITYVMNQFASQAHLTGESIAFMAAMSATLIEAGEEQGKGGRALKMIYARLGADTSGAATALHELGVATKDADGNLRPLSDIIRDLVINMEDKTAADKQNIAQLVAGNRHYVRLIKLMENYSRVEELALEATLALSPAQEEVDRRLKENITSLRIAEAELYNYQATLSDSLVPSLTRATERQTDFTVVLGELSTGILGPVISSLGGFIKLVEKVAAPMIQATISLNQLNVASQTYRVLTRAIAGEELVREGFLGRYQDKLTSITATQEHLTAVMKGYRKELKEIHELQTVMQITAIDLSEDEIRGYEETLDKNSEMAVANRERLLTQQSIKKGLVEEMALIASATDEEKKSLLQTIRMIDLEEQYTNETVRKGQATRQINLDLAEGATLMQLLQEERKDEIAAVTEAIKLIRQANQTREEESRMISELLASHYGQKRAEQIMIELEAEREAEEERKKSMKTMQARTALINQFSLITMAASGVLTIFGKSEKSARMAMIMSTASMIPYIANMMHSIVVTEADAAAKGLAALAADALGVANLRAALSTGVLSAAMKTAWASAKKFALLVGGFIAVAAAITFVAEKMGFFNTEFKNLDDTISQSVLLDADEVLRIFNLGVEDSAAGLASASAELKIINDEIQALEDAGKVVPSDLTSERQRWETIVGNHERANELAREKQLLDKHDIDTLKELTTFEDDRLRHAERMVGMARALAYNPEFYGTENYYKHLNSIQAEFGHILGDNAVIWEEMQAIGLTTTEEIEGAARTLAQIDARGATEGIISVSDELTNAKNALYEFNDAREELFFGFAASNVTGDLVKQVVNKGVETLITNTEVIMTNNFNGMTTDEVADEILLQIERRAGSLSGITISG